MKNYVISLSTAYHRRKHIMAEFTKHHVHFEFFNAKTPNDINDLAPRFNPHLKDSSLLSDGEKACLLSHVCLWQQMLDNDIDYLAIFEDDVYLGQNANVFFNNSQWLKKAGIDYLKTETFLQEKKLSDILINLPDNRCVKVLHESHLGTAGYIISQKTAKILLDFIKNLSQNDLKPIDHLMFDDYRQMATAPPIYQMLPAIVAQEFILYPTQNAMPSNIKNDRDKRKKNKPKRSLSAKIKGELSNVYRKTLGKLSRTKIAYR